jgi:RNA polymerase sigma-70 factor (ECF subfamily)
LTGRVPRLVEEAQGGSTEAFEELVRLHLGMAFAVARSFLPSKEDAEDAVQDALVRAWQRLDQCRDPHRFRAWLATVVRRIALDHLERTQVRIPVRGALTPELVDPLPGPERAAERRRIRDRLEALVNTLSEVQRAVLLLHDLEGYSHGEIAELLQISNESSRRYLSDAKRLLRSRFRSEEDRT